MSTCWKFLTSELPPSPPGTAWLSRPLSLRRGCDGGMLGDAGTAASSEGVAADVGAAAVAAAIGGWLAPS
eukprot:9664230-Alexandrium_andersonii.AAC.1